MYYWYFFYFLVNNKSGELYEITRKRNRRKF